MNKQNVYAFTDNVECPEGEGQTIRDYLDGLFLRASRQILSLKQPIDWLVVKSSSLEAVVHGSQNFFEKEFEQVLKKIISENISVIKYHSNIHGGAISEETVYQDIKETMKQEDVEMNCLNPLNINLSYLLYHLNMRNSSN